MRTVLFVCAGNTCRSPLAQAIARDLAERRGLEVLVESAGLTARDGAGASEEAVAVARGRGLDLSRHRARRLSSELVDRANVVVAVDRDAVGELAAREKVRLHHVDDPFGADLAAYERMFAELERVVEEVL